MYVCKKKHTSRSWVLVAPLEKKIQLMLQKKNRRSNSNQSFVLDSSSHDTGKVCGL